nr:MAG TPA: portal protein [Caudoviricetes sp.]
MKNMIRNWLEIKSPDSIQIDIEQLNNYESQAFINNIWYRGDPSEIQQLYEQLNDRLGNKHFWGSKPTVGMNIRKIHTGLPSMIVDTLADISTDDLDKIEAGKRQEEWNKIAEENNPKALLRDAVVGTLVCGDGAFKWSVDTEISKYPIIEYYDGSRVDFEYERGRLTAVVFKTKKLINKQRYTLLERYSKKDITYKLVNKEGKECKIEDFPELINKYQSVINTNEFMMALPVMFKKSKKYEGRGKSLLDGKLDNFDAFDEVWSQWMLALRKGQIKTYIPESLLPRDPETGLLLRGSDLDNDFISVEETISEDGASKNKIETTQGQIQYEALLSTYITALDQCLTGLISPSTLGIDTKKIDNAEATREKEKTTLYKRNQIVEVLTKVISDMVNITFKVLDTMNDNEITDTPGVASFGGYANPSFEAQIETIGKAKANGIMSVETSVEELYGDTKDDNWKKEEVQRIKNEQGIVDMEEPSINNDLDLIENKEILNMKVGESSDRK